MSARSLVELTVRWGEFGENANRVALPIGEDLTRELLNGVELSDDPFSLMVASGRGLFRKDDAVVERRRAFKMRRRVAEDIARAMVPALLKAFGVNDELDGYRIEDMREEEREFHRRRGRLPTGY